MESTDLVKLVSIGFGSVIFMVYILNSILRRHKKDISLKEGLSLLLAGVMIPQGIYMIYLATNSDKLGCVQIDPIFLLVGGFTVIWLSIERIDKGFRKSSDIKE